MIVGGLLPLAGHVVEDHHPPVADHDSSVSRSAFITGAQPASTAKTLPPISVSLWRKAPAIVSSWILSLA
jgi:hypothetical protein